jgi:hypothetical protein
MRNPKIDELVSFVERVCKHPIESCSNRRVGNYATIYCSNCKNEWFIGTEERSATYFVPEKTSLSNDFAVSVKA